MAITLRSKKLLNQPENLFKIRTKCFAVGMEWVKCDLQLVDLQIFTLSLEPQTGVGTASAQLCVEPKPYASSPASAVEADCWCRFLC